MLRFRISEFADKLILISVMLIFLFVGISSLLSIKKLDTISRHERPMLVQSKEDVPVFVAETVASERPVWEGPQSQSRGTEWVFDLFTPPVVYFNPNTREFTVSPPTAKDEPQSEDPWRFFNVELLDVRPRPYRLQLIGYAGEDGNYLASFEYIPTQRMMTAKEGTLLVEAGVKMVSFEIKRMEVQQEGSMPVFESVGVAKLLDFESGEEIYLTNLETKLYSDLEARLRTLDDKTVHVVREGSQIELDTSFYVIGDLSTNPAEAMVTKVSKDGSKRLSRLLKPTSQENPLSSREDGSGRRSPFAIRPKN